MRDQRNVYPQFTATRLTRSLAVFSRLLVSLIACVMTATRPTNEKHNCYLMGLNMGGTSIQDVRAKRIDNGQAAIPSTQQPQPRGSVVQIVRTCVQRRLNPPHRST